MSDAQTGDVSFSLMRLQCRAGAPCPRAVPVASAS